MVAISPELKAIFWEALDCPSEAERRAYLDRACQGDATLRTRIDALLVAHQNAGDFLEEPVPTPIVSRRDATPLEGPGTIIGPYKLLEQIGEGGFGVVFMAEQTHPVRRKVAHKVLKPGMDTRQVVARFEAERQVLAIMDHPEIAKVHDAGVTDLGRPYFVMELVKGVPITRYCDERCLTLRQRLELFIPVCQAIQHAHQKGVIHRDLKPSNVLIALCDGKPVPKVIDFGVAKAAGPKLTEATLFTGFGMVIGTPEYMSPEQAQLDNLDIDTRSDIYSLGVLLYELLTGTTPFAKRDLEKAGLLETLRMIREQDPPKPSTKLSTAEGLPTLAVNRGTEPARLTNLVRGELDWIVMKALEKDRTRRYETASGLAMDLERYLADEPVHACPPSAAYRFRKFARRNRRAVATAAATALVVMLSLAVSAGLIWRAVERERREANFHRITEAHWELSADNLDRALKLLDASPQDLRSWEWRYLTRLCRVDPLVISDDTEVHGVAFSPDGELIASAGGDGTVKIWDSRTGARLQTIPAHKDAVVSVAFHPDGKHLASRGRKELKVWDLTAPDRPVFTKKCDATRDSGAATTIAFGPDGRQLAAATDGVVNVWDWKNRELLHQGLPGHDFHSIPLAYSRDGRLATGTWREGVKVWDPRTRTLLLPIPEHDEPVSAVAFSADGNWLASASYDRTVKLWNSKTGAHIQSFDLRLTGNVECVAINRNGQIASSGEDKTVHVWDAMSGRELLSLHGHTRKVESVAYSRDGDRLVSAGSDRTIRFWDATPLRGDEKLETLTFTEHRNEVRTVAISPDGQQIASAGMDGVVKVWDAQTRRVSAEFSDHRDSSGHPSLIFCVAWHPAGNVVASAGWAVRVWDARSRRELFPLLTSGVGSSAMPYNAVAFSPDGRYLVTGKADGAVRVWDAATGRDVGSLDTHKRTILALVFSRDGAHLASVSADGTVKLWDAKRLEQKQQPRRILHGRVPGQGVNVAFSPDGRRLATGGEKNSVTIWEVATGQELKRLEGHRGEVYALAFSPDDDGRWIASAGEDSTVKVWDSHTGKILRSFRGHRGLVSSVAFSPDGRFLVSGGRDTTVKIWDLTPLGEVSKR
jgi:WD40 repeat protein/serine/threonine protein kinase